MKKVFLFFLLIFFVRATSYGQRRLNSEEIIHKYLLLVGNLKDVPAFSYQLLCEGNQGNSIKYKNPAKLCITYLYGQEEVAKIYYDGKNFGEYTATSQKPKPFNHDNFCREALSNMLFPELLISALKIKTISEGIEIINQRKVEKIKFETPQGHHWSAYFDVESGLKIRTAFEIKTDEGEMQKATLDFQDYRDIDAFHLPQKLLLTIGNLEMVYFVRNFKVDETFDDIIFEAKK